MVQMDIRTIQYKMVNRLLNEAYLEPDLSWVDKFVNELYTHKDLDALENDYLIVISIDNENVDTERMIQKASYDPVTKKYHIYLSDKNIDDIDRGYNREQFTLELKRVIYHEDTHRLQDQNDAFSKTKIANIDNTKEYVSNYHEIDAFAREVALSFKELGYSLQKTVEYIEKINYNISSNDKIEKDLKEIIWQYRNADSSVYRKFLKEVYFVFKRND
jgi:hypothetical protein